MKKVLFMGTPDYADTILKKLLGHNNIEVVGVFTQPDKPVGRKKLLTPPPVKQTALQHHIPVYQPSRLRDDKAIEDVLGIACDYIVVAAYGQILPRQILDYAPCINLHASILPQYRGASPIQQTLLNGDTKTGVTAMLMEEGLDTGDIIKIETVEVTPDEMVESLFHKLTEIAAELTIDVLENFESYTPVAQDDAQATYCKKITKADGEISFDNAQTIYNKYRAFTPWPAIFTKDGLKLKEIALHDTQTKHQTAGQILSMGKKSIIVSCLQGSLEIFKVQPASKKEMDVLSYCNGKRLSVEDYLS